MIKLFHRKEVSKHVKVQVQCCKYFVLNSLMFCKFVEVDIFLCKNSESRSLVLLSINYLKTKFT